MSKEIFAMNPRLKDSRTGKIQARYHKGYAEPATEEQVMQRLKAEDVKEDARLIREEGREELKDEGLFTLCPHYSSFRDNHRCQESILPERFTYKTCVDVDDLQMVEHAIRRALEVNEDPMSDWENQVLYIEYSPRNKVHIWLLMPVGKTVEETQREFCEEIGVPYDKSCTTPERYINMTGREIYRSERWLQPIAEKDVEERREAFLMRGLDMDGRPLQKPATTPSSPIQEALEQAGEAVEPDERVAYIMGACMRENELQPADFQQEGSRHNNVKVMLSVACQLVSREEFLGWLRQVMPDGYWQSADMLRLVSDFYAKYNDPSQKFTQFQLKVLRESRKWAHNEHPKAEGTAMTDDSPAAPERTQGSTSPLTDIYACPNPPELDVANLPRLVKVVTQQTPQQMKATVAQGMFPPLAVYPQHLRFLYIDNLYRELRMNCLTIGETGSGKDTSLKQPLKHITAPMVERDRVNRQRLKEFNEEYNSTKNTKDKPKRPDDLIIQKVGADLTSARLSQLMDDSQGAFLYTHLHEFEQWYGIEGMRGQACTFKNLKLADDEDNPFGQERAGAQSVNYMGPLGLNWNASTTPGKAQQMFRYCLVDGPLSRLCLATTPSAELGAPIPRYGKYDERYDKALMPYIDHLKEATGDVTCHPAMRLAERLKAECDQYTLLTQDAVFDNLSHRALVHAFRKACLLYAANGMKWEKNIEGFCRWSLHYDLWIKLRLWGDSIRKAESEVETSRRGPQSLLEIVKKDENGIFTLKALEQLKSQGRIRGSVGNLLAKWKCRGYICQMTDDSFKITR